MVLPVSYVIVLAVVANIVCSQSEDPIVSTDYGDLRGFQGLDHLNRTYDAFLGVPFAKPPLDHLRWQPSEAPEPWDGVRNATHFGYHCIQLISRVYRLIGFENEDSEDCLFLDIYVPQSVEHALSNPLPVMVYYYGGALVFGTTEMYPGYELAVTGDVIVVSVSYRVSVMGFFSTGDSVAPGNYGLWDGKSSLEWINNNIGYFGGDRDRITVFGQSAGGGFVSHLMLSPQTNHLFDRVIAISGSAGYQDDPVPSAEHLARQFNCSTNSSQEMADCLMEFDGKRLDNKFYLGSSSDGIHGFGTVIDGTFITQDPRDSWKQGAGGHIDLMNGYTYHDSAGFLVGLLGFPRNKTNDGNKYNYQIENFWYFTFSRYDNVDDIMQALYDQYPLMNHSDPEVATRAAARVRTDFDFASLVYYQVEKHAEYGGNGSNYFYEFRYSPSFLTGYPDWVNGSHTDDIYSFLGQAYMEHYRDVYLRGAEYSEDDEAVSEIIMKYYANFAYTGDPNTGRHEVPVFWPQYSMDTRQYLVESVTPYVLDQGPAHLDHFNWLLYDFRGMMRPGWGEPYGEQIELSEHLVDTLLSDLDDDDDWEYY